MARAAHFAFLMLTVTCLLPVKALAQGETTSAIVGQVRDTTNAVVPGATVTIANPETGLRRTAKTDDAGRFNFPQLKPGTYSVTVEARGFDPGQNDNVVSGLGQKQTVDFTLKVARSSETVEVSSEAPLINPENANTSTTLNAPALEDLPNPGGDLTYPLQFAPGALINTAGSSNDFVGGTNGYGNVEFNGLPALSNGYIVDGLETNDPLTNLNSGLSTNLVLGLNSISEVTVNTLSYSVDQGRYGASQVDYVTKSGTNRFHGNLYELWNGSLLNAADYFTNATPGNHKPRSTVNHFGGSVGGPIAHDRLFFFFDSEWVRIALPIVTPTIVPSPGNNDLFQTYVLGQLSSGQTTGCVSSGPNKNCYPAAPQEVDFYQQIFKLYGNASGTPTQVLWCPFNSDGTPAPGNPPNGNGCANRQSVSHSSDDHEQVQTVRVDYNINEKDTAWFRFQSDTGLQAAYTDPINPVFNAFSPQPLYSFAAGYTHVFSQNLVNYFNPAFSWYESLFGPSNLQKTLSAFPIVLQGSGANAFTPMGGLDNTWIQGRRASRFFINDNLAWSHGAHELRFGTNTRIFRLNDYDFGEGTVPTVTYANLQQFIYGVANTASKTFPSNANEPFNFLNLDVYAQDTWKVTRTLTWTFGLRDTFNSNPLNPHDQVARLRGSFSSISHDVNQPLNAGHPDPSRQSVLVHTGGHSATENGDCVAIRAEIGAPHRFRNFQRHLAGHGGRPDRRQSSIRQDVPGRTARQRGPKGIRGLRPGRRLRRHRARSAEQRSGRNRCRESDFYFGISPGPVFSSAGCDHSHSRWQTPRAVLHGVEPGNGTSIRNDGQPEGAIRGHAGREPAVLNPSQRLPNRVPGLFCAVPLHAAYRSTIRRGDAVLHRREQSLQRSSTDRDEAARPWLARTGQLHLEPLHGYGLERRVPFVFRRRDSLASAGRPGPRLWSLRL